MTSVDQSRVSRLWMVNATVRLTALWMSSDQVSTRWHTLYLRIFVRLFLIFYAFAFRLRSYGLFHVIGFGTQGALLQHDTSPAVSCVEGEQVAPDSFFYFILYLVHQGGVGIDDL
jgi:hypothetical protein